MSGSPRCKHTLSRLLRREAVSASVENRLSVRIVSRSRVTPPEQVWLTSQSAPHRRDFTAPSMKLGPIATKMGRRASVNVLIAAAITNTLPGLLNTRRVFTASAEMVGASEPP